MNSAGVTSRRVLGMLATAALVLAASTVTGEGVARALGLERWRAWSPAVGLGVLIVAALLAVKLPGHGSTGAAVLAVLVTAAAVMVLSGGRLRRPPAHVLALTCLTAIAVCIPYIASGRYGIPGVSFNNDLANHLPWASSLQNPGLPGEQTPSPGYPLGAHSFVAALSSAIGASLATAFAALLVSCPLLIGWTALGLLDGLSRPRQVLAALMVAVAYTVSAYYAQANFKELLLTLFLLAMVAMGRDAARHRGDRALRRGIQLGAPAAGIVVGFSYAGLVWPAAAAALWAVAAIALALVVTPGALSTRIRVAVAPLRAVVPLALGAALATGLLVLGDLSRLLDAVQIFGSSPSGTGILPSTELGNLLGQVSKREIFGFWPSVDFRYGVADTPVNQALGALAILVACYGVAWWTWRRDLAVPAAAAAALLIAVYLSRTEAAYVAAKALAPAGALTMLLGARAILGTPPRLRMPRARLAFSVVAAVFAGAVLWSSFMVLRGAQIGPQDHQRELARLEPAIAGEKTLFLGSDEFVRAMLPGVAVHWRPLGRRLKAANWDGPFDFDSPTSAELDEFRFVVAPRTRYRSDPPANFALVDATRSFELWERRGPTVPRRVLDEGTAPGATLDCSTRAGRELAARAGWAKIWLSPPRMAPTRLLVPTGEKTTFGMDLGAGHWELSAQYNATQPVSVDFGGGTGGSLPAKLDRGGPFWRIATVRRERPGHERIDFAVDGQPLGADTHFGVLFGVAAVELGRPHTLVPLSEACGRYVDWYTLGPERPSGE